MAPNDTLDHPRRFRVTRDTPGSTWGSWTHTYHRTEEAAREAATRFFAGAGHYRLSRSERAKTSTVTIAERLATVGSAPATSATRT